MRRGDVYWVDLEPVVGSEANKVRPAVLVSNDAANRAALRAGAGVVTVVPLTSSLGRVLPFQVLVPAAESGLPDDSKAQAEQVRSLSATRLGEREGCLQRATLEAVDEALRLHLAL